MSTNSWKIEVQQDYFARIAAKEYSDDAGMAVIREFAQNSADAGATRVEFEFSGSGDGQRLMVRDNGRGCSAETVKSRLLTPLGTKKEADAIGGFGKAKELLFFANPSWEITTRNVRVQGSFLSVQNFDEDCSHFAGFAANVQLPSSLHNAAWSAARNFMRCSERPNVSWFLNGEEVTCEVERAQRATKDFGFCKAYVNRDVEDSVIYLRTGGLLTALRRGYHGSKVGQVIIEVTGASSELLTPARDWFRSQSHRQQIDNWLNQLVTNATATLAEEFGDEIRFEDFEEVQPLTADQLQGLSRWDVVPQLGGAAPKVAIEASIPEFLNEVDPAGCLDKNEELEGRVTTPRPPQRHRDGFDMSLLPRVPSVNRLVVHTGGKAQAKVASRWLKKHAATAFTLLAAWATAVRVVATKAELPMDAIGFTFAAHANAEYVKVQGRFALLLNPTTLDLSDADVAEELLDRALHEAAHLVTGSGHDEDFVKAERNLRIKTRGPITRGAINRALRTNEVQTIEVLS